LDAAGYVQDSSAINPAQTAIEYCLIAVGISIVIIAAVNVSAPPSTPVSLR